MEFFDMKAEEAIPLSQAAGLLPGRKDGSKLSIRTLERWIRHGHRGVFLECAVLGRLIYTSRESLQRFSQRCAQQLSGKAPHRPPAVAKRSHERAKRVLERAGFGKGSQQRGGKPAGKPADVVG